MNRTGSILITFLIAVILAVITLATDPFRYGGELLGYLFGAGPNWTKIDSLYVNRDTQEISHGDNPLPNLTYLEAGRCEKNSGRRLVYLVGNSQTHATILAPGERPDSAPEKTYPDLINEYLRSKPRDNSVIYRLSAPNISYPEALWYVTFVTAEPALQPREIILQLNYESFRKVGIRDGMLGLLAVSGFRKHVEEIARGQAAYADVFRQALERYRVLGPKNRGQGASTSGSTAIGEYLENNVRSALTVMPWFGHRHELKASFLNLLYLSRVYFLNIRPTTPRSIGGAPFQIACACLARISDLCRQNGVRLVAFNAPQNPQAILYKTSEDRLRYLTATRAFAGGHSILLLDFERSIPSELWGQWVDGPDPIHFGRQAHRLMARLMIESGVLE